MTAAVRQSHRPSFVSALLVSGAAAAALGSAAPAAAQRTDAEVKAEIAFARGLAASWSFVALAEQVLSDVESGGVSGKMREELGLVTCDVYSIGARNERDTTRRTELFERAITSYTDFIAQNPYSDFRPSAEAALVNTAATFARAIDQALEEAVGEEAAELSTRKVDVLTEAVNLTQELIEALSQTPSEERSEKDQRELQGLMLNRGIMLAEIGRASEDGDYFYNEAISSLEEMVFEFGEGTPPALRAYNAMGDVYTYMGEPTEAVIFYQGVVDSALPIDPDLMDFIEENNGGPLDEGQIALRYLFLELSTSGLLEALTTLGDTQQACTYGLHYYNLQRQEGLNWTPGGYMSVLAVARTLLDAGGFVGGDATNGTLKWYATEEEMKQQVRARKQQTDAVSFALKLANTVNEENKGNILQVRAQKLISEISNRPGIEVSPEVLVQAAQGEYYDGNYDAAIEGLRKVMRSLETRDPSERLEYGGRVMNFMANSLRRSGRELEAAMAFREGISTWAGDPEYDTQNAQGFDAMMRNVSQRSPGDAALQALKSESENAVARHGDERNKGRLAHSRGKKAYGEKDWDGAIEFYSTIDESDDYYEKALVEIAVCRFRKGESDAALSAFDNYVEVYVKDPANATQSPVRQARRSEALAAAEFFRGLILYTRADKSGDEPTYRRITELLTDYHVRYATQDVLAPWTMQNVMLSHLALGERTEARAMIDALVTTYPDNRRTGLASKQFYNYLKRLRDEESTAADEKITLLREMAEFLKLGNELGSADFAALRNESRHWLDLGEYVEAERVLSKVASRYANDTERAGDMTKHVLPDLGRALMENGKVADAKAILNPLVLDDGAKPSKATVLLWARSIAGWLTGSGTQVQEMAGAGGSETEWAALIKKLDTITKSGDKWQSCEWYEQKLMIVYAYYSWGQSDQRKLDSAKGQMKQMDSQLRDDTYAVVNGFCDESSNPAMVAGLGGGTLQSRYKHMARLLR